MKKGYVISAIIGGTFFAVPYLALNVPILPSAIMAGIAYGAGNLIFNSKKNNNLEMSSESGNLYDILNNAKSINAEVYSLMKKVEDKDLIQDINEIHDLVAKIIDAISKKPEKVKQAHNFLNYYLPVTVKILRKYDEIENQGLNTSESKKFMSDTKEMIKKIKNAFHEQLSNMYQSDMIDTDAEMKVFETMLKTDGFSELSDFKKDNN